MKSLVQHLTRALEAARELAALLQNTDHLTSVRLSVHATNLQRILTDLETL